MVSTGEVPPPAPCCNCSQKGVASARAAQELGQQSRTSGARATQELGQQCTRAEKRIRREAAPAAARAPQVERGRARRRAGAGREARAPQVQRRGAPKPPQGDVLDEWEPLYFDAGQQEQKEPEAEEEEEAPLFVVDSAPAAANVVRVAYDGGEAELPAPACSGAARGDGGRAARRARADGAPGGARAAGRAG